MTLLRLLHEQAAAAGVDLRFEHNVPDPPGGRRLRPGGGADGPTRRRGSSRRTVAHGHVASAKFIWLATTKLFDGLTFIHERGPTGLRRSRLPLRPDASTFIVENRRGVVAAGRSRRLRRDQPPGQRPASAAYLEALFADHLDGHPCWSTTPVGNSGPRCGRWRSGTPSSSATPPHRPLLGGVRHRRWPWRTPPPRAVPDRQPQKPWRPRRRPRRLRDRPPPAVDKTRARQPQPVVVGALRPLPRPPGGAPVRLPLLLPGDPPRQAGHPRSPVRGRRVGMVGRPVRRSPVVHAPVAGRPEARRADRYGNPAATRRCRRAVPDAALRSCAAPAKSSCPSAGPTTRRWPAATGPVAHRARRRGRPAAVVAELETGIAAGAAMWR